MCSGLSNFQAWFPSVLYLRDFLSCIRSSVYTCNKVREIPLRWLCIEKYIKCYDRQAEMSLSKMYPFIQFIARLIRKHEICSVNIPYKNKQLHFKHETSQLVWTDLNRFIKNFSGVPSPWIIKMPLCYSPQKYTTIGPTLNLSIKCKAK